MLNDRAKVRQVKHA